MIPPACNHPEPIRIREAQVVYGTPGILFARYRCSYCKVEWDDPTERPLGQSIEYKVVNDD